MIRRISEEPEPDIRVIVRSIEALIVNKLTADINSRDVPVSDDELAYLSTILDTESDNVRFLLSHQGAIEFTNMVLLTLDGFHSTPGLRSVTLDQTFLETFRILSQALPPELNAAVRLGQTYPLMNNSDGQCGLIL